MSEKHIGNVTLSSKVASLENLEDLLIGAQDDEENSIHNFASFVAIKISAEFFFEKSHAIDVNFV